MKNQIIASAIGLVFMMTTSIHSFAINGPTLPKTLGLEKNISFPTTESTFLVIEEDAEFPGGEEALMEYFDDNIQYPMIAKQQGIVGKVTVALTINESGTISNIEVIQGIGGGCEEEVIRVLSSMPTWKPTNQAGHMMKTKKLFSFNFQL